MPFIHIGLVSYKYIHDGRRLDDVVVSCSYRASIDHGQPSPDLDV